MGLSIYNIKESLELTELRKQHARLTSAKKITHYIDSR